jgi:hypothetical protein
LVVASDQLLLLIECTMPPASLDAAEAEPAVRRSLTLSMPEKPTPVTLKRR